MNTGNITHNLNEYLLNQKKQALFQEHYQRTQREQQLYVQWKYAVDGWSSINCMLQESINQRKQLETLNIDLQNQIDEQKKVLQRRVATSAGMETAAVTPGPSGAGFPSPRREYGTDEEELARETEWIRVKNKNKKRKLNLTPEKKASPENQRKLIKKEKLPPPIMIHDIKSCENLYEILTSKIKEEEFKIKLTSNTTAKVNCTNSESYREVVKQLNSEKINFHTYENKQTRPIRVMAKNLHSSYNPENIKNFLLNKGFKIITVNNKMSWKEKTLLNMFMLTFDNNEDIEKIFKINQILGCTVEIVPVKGSKLIPQCKKCQAFGHTQKYCAREPRCVKCAGKHITSNCQKSENQKPKCVNCGEEHPANYRGCVVAKELQKLRTKNGYKDKPKNENLEKDKSNVQKENINITKQDKPNYASIAAIGTNSQIKPQEANDNQTLQLILNKITQMENSLLSMDQKIKQFELEGVTKKESSKNKNSKKKNFK